MIDKFINKIQQGNSLDILKQMPDNSVDCVITSPPYWQLRDYGYDDQWGLEPTYQEYLEHLWSLMDETYRILKPTGTAWINLGDTYATKSGNMGVKEQWDGLNKDRDTNFPQSPAGKLHKCLLLIPHRFAIGCIDRGWIVRNDIIWAKRNGMPESVTDRFSKKHEYFFLMVKQSKYYFDLDGIRDKHKEVSIKRLEQNIDKQKGSDRSLLGGYKTNGNMKAVGDLNLGKNPGDVSDFWDITTKGSSEKHYASFNFKLIEKPIIAGCPEGGIILDPFCGVGTTLIRALQLGRRVIGIDGSKEYCEIATNKIRNELNQLKIFA